MRENIDQGSLKQILQTTERTYTEQLSWDPAVNEVFIEGAVVDDVHHEIFNGEPPPEFAALYIYVPTEEPRKTLSNHRQEIRNFMQRNWRGSGGVILAEQMIDGTIRAVVAHHRQLHSVD